MPPRRRNGQLRPIPINQRFWLKVRKTGTCWLWTGAHKPTGYGDAWYRNRRQNAHRVAWQLLRGRIPKGKFVLHQCDTPACVNPGHLFLGTQKVNMTDCIQKGRFSYNSPPQAQWTHCRRGHEFTPENTRAQIRSDGRHRTCITCHKMKDRAWKAQFRRRSRATPEGR